MIKTSKRLNNITEYYFSRKIKEISDLDSNGKDIINLGIGNPDLPPHPDVIKVLQEAAVNAGNHGYQSYRGSSVLRAAMSSWYNRWYNVAINPDTELLPLIGSKEGIFHLCMTYLNKGDKILIPNPGYPAYRSAALLAEAECIEYELLEKNNWFPDFNLLESVNLSNVKMMWINYPNMPTGQTPAIELFEQVIAFGRKHNILICHDNPYSFTLNKSPLSILSITGAKEVAIELNSLSKSHNMAGWRVGLLAGDEKKINDVLRFKSNLDSGMFLPVQLAAAKALTLPADWYEKINYTYQTRVESAYELLDALNCKYNKAQAGLFIWAKISEVEKDCYTFCDNILYKAGVFITPGGIFGSAGNRYVRLSLCSPKNLIQKAIQRVEEGTAKKI
jgi:aspartate/methionine/tyrosine aminotransferase